MMQANVRRQRQLQSLVREMAHRLARTHRLIHTSSLVLADAWARLPLELHPAVQATYRRPARIGPNARRPQQAL